MGMRFLLLAGMFAAAVAVALVHESRLEAQVPPLSVKTALPGWRAPGGRLTVQGTAGAGEVVRLFVGSRAIERLQDARAQAGAHVGRVETQIIMLRDQLRAAEAELDGARARQRAIEDQLAALGAEPG